MSHFTWDMNIVNALMIDNEYADEVKANMIKFKEMFDEFMKINQSYTQILNCKEKTDLQ